MYSVELCKRENLYVCIKKKMENKLYILIAFIIFLVLVILISSFIILHASKSKNENSNQKGYAQNNDPYEHPYILKNFLSPKKCKEIILYAESKLVDSETVGGKNDSVRNSQQCWIPKTHSLAKPLFEKVSAIYNIPFENGEDLQVVRYLPGQFFKEHHDSCCDGTEKCKEFITKGGQRIVTVLIYLNNEFEEGHTFFRKLNLRLKPPTGDAIVFFPLAKDSNKCHPLALHAGMPVTSGTKWVANLWFRENKFVA